MQIVRKTTSESCGAVSRSFVAKVGEQLRDNYVIIAARRERQNSTRRLRKRDILPPDAAVVDGKEPLAPELVSQGTTGADSRNIVTQDKRSFAFNLLQALHGGGRTELSEPAEKQTPVQDLITVPGSSYAAGDTQIAPQPRAEENLAPLVVDAFQIPLTPNPYTAGTSAIVDPVAPNAPVPIPELASIPAPLAEALPLTQINAGDPNTPGENRPVDIIGGITTLWESTTDLTPEFDERRFLKLTNAPLRRRNGDRGASWADLGGRDDFEANATTTKTEKKGAQLQPPRAGDKVILYKKATIKLSFDLRPYPQLDKSQIYILDVLSGEEIKVTAIEGDRFGKLVGELKQGEGSWGCEWRGGGAFAIGVSRNPVEPVSGAEGRRVGWAVMALAGVVGVFVMM